MVDYAGIISSIIGTFFGENYAGIIGMHLYNNYENNRQVLEVQVSMNHSINISRPDGRDGILMVNYLLGILG